MLSLIIVSKILQSNEIKLRGLSVLSSDLELFLNNGVTLAFYQSSGITPDFKKSQMI